MWAPRAETIELRLGGETLPLTDAGFGIHETVAAAAPGTDYEYVVGGRPLPDPCTRWQPEGLRGTSRLFDARSLPGARDGFEPARPQDLVVYELHVGTFSEEGTFRGRSRTSTSWRRWG